VKIGIYLNSGDVRKGPDVGLPKLIEARAARANLWIESPDGRRAPLYLLKRWARALERAGIEPWLWTFPDAAKAGLAGEHLVSVAQETGARGVWLDIERPPPSSPASEWSVDSAKRLIDAIDIDIPIGVTSYPVRSNFKTKIPFELFEIFPLGGPQLYRSVAITAQREKAIREWKAAHRSLVPIVGAWLGDAARLDTDVRNVTSDRFESFDVWVLGVLDASERKTLALWAEK